MTHLHFQREKLNSLSNTPKEWNVLSMEIVGDSRSTHYEKDAPGREFSVIDLSQSSGDASSTSTTNPVGASAEQRRVDIDILSATRVSQHQF